MVMAPFYGAGVMSVFPAGIIGDLRRGHRRWGGQPIGADASVE